MRKGLGLHRGKGYRNLICTDPRIHSQSRRGIRQRQKLPLLTTSIYNGTYGRKLLHPELIIESLKRAKIEDVRYSNGRIKLKFNGQPISNTIKENPTVRNIANWGHSFTDNRVFIDKDAPSRYKPQLALHEAIEQHISEKHGLKYPEAHQIAEHFEQQYAESKGIDWDSSQKAIFKTKL